MTLFLFVNSLLIFVFLLNKFFPWAKKNQNFIINLLNTFLLIKLSLSEHLDVLKKLMLNFVLLSLVFFFIFPINTFYFFVWPCILISLYIIKLRKKQFLLLETITLDFPFFLNLLQSHLQTGLSIHQSIEKISACLHTSPLKNMLFDFIHMSNTVPSLNLVTKKIHARYPNQHVLNFCNIISESIQHGTPIVQSLQSFADDVESQHYLYAEQQIQKIPVKLLAPLMLCIFPVTFIIIFMPIILSFIQ